MKATQKEASFVENSIMVQEAELRTEYWQNNASIFSES